MKIVFIQHVPTLHINKGLAYVMSAVGHNFDVSLYDINVGAESFEAFLQKRLALDNPAFICFSVNSFSFGSAINLAGFCKNICPDARIIFGGVHATLMPEETLGYREVDYICIGEGEEAMLELLNSHLYNKESIIPGIWRKDREENIVKAPLRPYIKDINSLPMLNLDYWDMEKYIGYNREFGRGLDILSSRGCPYDCNFCSAPALRRKIPGAYYRLRDPKLVAEEVDYQYKCYKHLGIQYLNFDDACFGYSVQHLKALAKELQQKGFPYGLPVIAQAHPAMISKEWIQAVKAIGCSLIAIGIESGDENIRCNVHNKDVANKQIKTIVRDLKDAGLMFSFYFILHAPKENWRSLLRTFIMLTCLMPTNECISVFRSLPGTRIAEDFKSDLWYLNNKRPVFLQFPNMEHPFSSFLYLGYKLYSSIFRGLQLQGLRFIVDIVKYLLKLKTRLFKQDIRQVLSDLYRATIVEYERDRYNKYKNET